MALASAPRRIVATYTYRDAEGAVVYDVIRTDPKGFVPRHPDSITGAIVTGLKGVDIRVPYRLPELLADTTRTVLWVEGEEDADRLAAEGFLTTATIGGAKSYKKHSDTYARHFHNRRLIAVIADNDDDGRAYANSVAASVYAVGAGVRVINLSGLTVKGDVSDWLDGGHTAEELRAIVKAAPDWEPSAANAEAVSSPDEIVLVPASSVKPERVNWAWEQRIPLGMATLLVGQGGFGKSLQLCSLAARWSRGIVAGHLSGTPIDVAIASAEDHRQSVIIPRLLAAGADLERIHFIEHRIDGDAEDIALDGEVAAIERALIAGKVRALLIDTVVAHIPGQIDSFKEQHVRRVLKPLAKMAERNDLAVVGVMHLNRRDARDVLTRISGSGGFGNLARSVLLFTPDPDDPEGPTRILALAKSNVGGKGATLKLRLDPCLVPHDDGDEISTVRLVELGESSYTSTQLLATSEDDEERNALREAEDFLRELLGDGSKPEAKAVIRLAKEAGIAEKPLRRAAKRIGVKTNDREGFGPGFPSRWSLLSQETPTWTVSTPGEVGEERPSRGTDVAASELVEIF
jgi:RecA-family ATPase